MMPRRTRCSVTSRCRTEVHSFSVHLEAAASGDQISNATSHHARPFSISATKFSCFSTSTSHNQGSEPAPVIAAASCFTKSASLVLCERKTFMGAHRPIPQSLTNPTVKPPVWHELGKNDEQIAITAW